MSAFGVPSLTHYRLRTLYMNGPKEREGASLSSLLSPRALEDRAIPNHALLPFPLLSSSRPPLPLYVFPVTNVSSFVIRFP